MSLPGYDSWKLASPPEDVKLRRAIEAAEHAASNLADIPEIDDDLPADADPHGNVYVEVNIRLKVPADDPQAIADNLSDQLLDLADRVGTPHERKKRPAGR